MTRPADDLAWPELELANWRPTRDTLHLWTQVVGKVRLALSPPQNHWWHVPLYVTTRGLTTGPMPYGERSVGVMFDFIRHQLVIFCSDGAEVLRRLEPMSVAAFYAMTLKALAEVGVQVRIWPVPVELPDPVPFADDHAHAAYDRIYAQRFWRALVSSERVMTAFRGRFVGKSSPTHFFWGSFDLAGTRFSGREAPPHPGVPIMPDFITRDAYSHEVVSSGFWPGGDGLEDPIFYTYAYPTPDGFAEAAVLPTEASWNAAFGEFVLPYAAVRAAADPAAALTAFLQTTYATGADALGWDRAALERRDAPA